jgi:hypothetical protein
MVTLDAPGWKSGRVDSTVLVLTPHDGDEYLIPMLGAVVGSATCARPPGRL